MNIAEKVKRVLAIVILICLFLPLAQCTSKQANNSRNIAAHTDVLIIAQQITFKCDDLPIIAAFLLPLGFVSIRKSVKTIHKQAFLSIVEILFASGSLFFIMLVLHLWGIVRYGGVILVIAYSGYILATLPLLLRILCKQRMQSPKTRHDLHKTN